MQMYIPYDAYLAVYTNNVMENEFYGDGEPVLFRKGDQLHSFAHPEGDKISLSIQLYTDVKAALQDPFIVRGPTHSLDEYLRQTFSTL